MPSLYTAIEIDAPRRVVWQALVSKDQWKYWNTFLYDCDPKHPFREGQRVLLSLRRQVGEAETEFEPIVTLIQPGTCLKWVSTIPGLVNEHVFELQEIGRDQVQFLYQENFSGILTRLVLPFIRQDEHQGMKRMARELKRYAEEQS